MGALAHARPLVVAAIAVILTANFSLLATDYSEARRLPDTPTNTATAPPTGFIVFGTTDTPVGRPTVFAVRGDGSDLRPSGRQPVRLDPAGPAWSHDGSERAEVRRRNGTDNVWIVERSSGAARQITTFSAGARLKRPVWSPDDRHVAFLFAEGKSFEIRVAAVDGSSTTVAYEPVVTRRALEYISLFGWVSDNMAE